MISKSSYSNYFKTTLKRKSWNIALPTLLFFLTMTLPALMTMSNYSDFDKLNETDLAHRFKNYSQTLTTIMGSEGIAIKATFIVLAVIAGISAFSYLHNKAKVDFYHSFPITRKAIFTCNYIASIIPVLIGFLINFIVSGILIATFGFGSIFLDMQILWAQLENIIYFIATFSVVALCTILCGNMVITLILSTVALLGHGVISGLVILLRYNFQDTFHYNIRLVERILSTSPATQFFNIMGESNVATCVAYIVVIAVIIAISLVCFMKRKSENSGMAISFEALKLPLKIYCCLIFGLGFGNLFGAMVNQSNAFWYYFGIVFGILLAHAISEMVFDYSFKSIFKHWIHGLAVVVLSCGLMAGLQFDVIGFDTRIVKANVITSFGYTSRYDSLYRGAVGSSSLKDPQNIEAIAQLMENSVADVQEQERLLKEGIVNIPPFCVKDYNSTTHFIIEAKKKPFGTFERNYFIECTDENIALFNQIRYSDEFKKEKSSIFSDQVVNAQKATVQSMNGNGTDGVVITDERVNELVQAMHKDYMNLTVSDGYMTIPECVVEFTYEVLEYDYLDDNRQVEYTYNGKNYEFLNEYPVYASYENTLALLNEWESYETTAINLEDIDRIELNEELIGYITRTSEDTNSPMETVDSRDKRDGVVTFTKPEEIAILMEHARASWCTIDDFGNSSNQDFEVFFKDSDSQYYTMTNDDLYDALKQLGY